MEQNTRPARKVGIADHLWDAFEEMGDAMGADRDALINQAMFMFARLNGFLETGGAASQLAQSPAVARSGGGRSAPPVLEPVQGGRRDDPPVASHDEDERSASSSSRLEQDPVRREVAERVLETAAELERLIKGKGDVDDDDRFSVDEPASEFDDAPPPYDEDEGFDASDADAEPEADLSLYLMAEGGEMDKITKDRFVIGRGKHCDFVINSGKVSREHAVILREGDHHYIEDLGSSNGTWFNKQRIKRRQVEDGDEYFICSEKIKLVMR